MPKVLMPIGDATEVLDTMYPFFRLPEDGFEVVVAGPEARIYHMVLHEIPPNAEPPWDITRETAGYHLRATTAFRDVRPEEYAGLFISGGRLHGVFCVTTKTCCVSSRDIFLRRGSRWRRSVTASRS